VTRAPCLALAILFSIAAGPLLAQRSAGAGATAGSSGAAAQADSLYASPADGAGMASVRAICESLTGHGVMRGDFAQTKDIKSLGRSFKGNGNFVISREDGIVWNTLKPFPSLMVVTAGRIVQFTGKGRTSVLDSGGNPVFEQFAATIRSVFSGDADELFSRFDAYFLAGDGGPGKPGGPWRIGLVPKDAVVRSIISSIELSGLETLDRFIMTEATGDTVRYEFSGQTFSAEPSDAERKLFAQ